MALSIAQNLTEYRFGQGLNLASQSQGAVANASSNAGLAPMVNNGDRTGSSGSWISVDRGNQEWVEVNFGVSRTVEEVDVIFAQDGAPATPTQAMTFGTAGVIDFDVQFFDGANWVSIIKVRGSNRVWRRLILPVAVTTNRIRVLMLNSPDGFRRLVELEAWGQIAGQGFPVFTASGAAGTVHWQTNSGGLSADTGAAVTLTPLNRTELATISAHDDATLVSKTIQIYGTLPTSDAKAVQPKWGIEADINLPQATWPMVYETREFAEYLAVLEFFNWHKQCVVDTSPAEDNSLVIRVVVGLPFYVKDIALGEIQQVYFDSAIRRSPQAADWVDYSFTLRTFNYLAP